MLSLLLGFKYYSDIFFPVYFDGYGLFEGDYPDSFRFLFGGQAVQVIDVVDAVVYKRVDGEVSYAERGQVLEKVRSLARVDAVVR